MIPQKNYKISFCTVCMNRIHHLKQTLSINIFDNQDYSNVEFILLDYNSLDGLEDYVKAELKHFIEIGKLIYYKTVSPTYFHRSHSRNLAFKLASGDIICNIDADNFTGKGFATYINNEFKKNRNGFLTANGAERATQDILGRICVKKSDFYALKGYDERMSTYGFEDHDFAMRLELNNLKKIFIPEIYFKAIKHEQTERISNEGIYSNLAELYVNYLTPASTCLLFLFKNKSCAKGILIDNDAFNYEMPLTKLKKSQLNYDYSLYEDKWLNGTWRKSDRGIELKLMSHASERLTYDNQEKCFISVTDTARKFFRLNDPDLTENAVMFFCQMTNRLIMAENKIQNKITVNLDFGRGNVFRNFNSSELIIV
jgi:hypothetical protein